MFINGLKFSNKKVSEKTRYTRYMPPNPCKHWVSCVTRCNAIFFKAQNPKGALGFCVIGMFLEKSGYGLFPHRGELIQNCCFLFHFVI